jgi:hypothetical protein
MLKKPRSPGFKAAVVTYNAYLYLFRCKAKIGVFKVECTF